MEPQLTGFARFKYQSCTRKQQYGRARAIRIAAHMMSTRRKLKVQPPDQRPMEAYSCNLCGRWHVGHATKEPAGSARS